MLSENSKPRNPNTSIESVTKDMTAFFLTNNNERLISILMREKERQEDVQEGGCGWRRPARRERCCGSLSSWHLLTKSSDRSLMTSLKHREQPVEQSYQRVAYAYHAVCCCHASYVLALA